MKKIVRRITAIIERRPLVSFFSILGVLLLLIIAGNIIRKPKAEPTAKAETPKQVEVFGIGSNPRIQVSAKVEKSGVVTLVSQSAGVVQAVNKNEGDMVYRGDWIFSLSTNYQGGYIPSLSRQIAQKNLDFVEDNFDTQKQMIDKRRDIANSTNAQMSELRDISRQSIDETKSLISLDEEILNSYDSQIQALESTNVGGANDSAIATLKGYKANVLMGLNAQRSALRNTEYQSSNDQEPAHLADVSRDLTLQQLDIEEKSLKLNREVSKINLRISQISESLMYPASPVNGTVERIYVHVGDAVTPGTRLATITGSQLSAKVVALVPTDTSLSVSRLEKSKISYAGGTIEVFPEYISSEPTDGQLHSIIYRVPDEFADRFKNGNYVMVQIPVAKQMTVAAIPYIPLDAIYQTQNGSYLFVASPVKGSGRYTAESRAITLGQVVGSYVEVKSGLKEEDQVIVNRDVVAGDPVTVK